jgi:hypothetical protein
MVAAELPLPPPGEAVWHVVCGDPGHWRAGMFAPSAVAREQVAELERHDCPELFVLLRGRLVLVVAEPQGVREIELEVGVPLLVTAPHAGYCPDGAHTGVAFVVERDSFDTEYRSIDEWRGAPT